MIEQLPHDADYREALRRVEILVKLDPPADSEDGRELIALSLLLRDYERKHFPLPA